VRWKARRKRQKSIFIISLGKCFTLTGSANLDFGKYKGVRKEWHFSEEHFKNTK